MYGSKTPHIVDDPANKCPGYLTIDDWDREVADVLGMSFEPLKLKPWYRRLHYSGFQWQNIINPCIIYDVEDGCSWPCTSIRLFGFEFLFTCEFEPVSETK